MNRRTSIKAAVLGFLGTVFGVKAKAESKSLLTNAPSGKTQLDGIVALMDGVGNQVFPHTLDAKVWAQEFNRTLIALGQQPLDEGWLVGWFANSIMAGFDTATLHAGKAYHEKTAVPEAAFHSTTKNFAFFWGGALALDEEFEKRKFHRAEIVPHEEILKENEINNEFNEGKTSPKDKLPVIQNLDQKVILKLFYWSKSKVTGKPRELWFRVWLDIQTGSLQEILADVFSSTDRAFKALDADFAPGGVYNKAPVQ